MTSREIIAAMVGVLLLLIVTVVVLIQIGALDDFLQTNSNRVSIDDEATMHQLILYDSTIAYVCSDEKGGFYRGNALAWESFESFKNNAGPQTPWSFDDLKKSLPASKSLVCSGSTQSIPTPSNKLSNIGGAKWINDQEGKFSKMRFSIEKDIELGDENGCFGFTGNKYSGDVFSDTGFVFSDKNSPNIFKFVFKNTDQLEDCRKFRGDQAIHEVQRDSFSGNWMKDNGDQPNVFSTVTVMASDRVSPLQKGSKGGTFIGDAGVTVGRKTFELCKGTKGYIQTNTGGKDAVKGPSGNLDDPNYSPENPPGFSDKEKTGNGKTENKVHPFIVITSNGC